jgi:drug/metabolite transporter, DME family
MEGATLEYESEERTAATAAAAARRERGIGVLMLIVASVLWSLSGVFVKTLKLPPITFTLYRSIGAAMAMALAVPILRGRRPRRDWMAFSALVYTAVVALLITAMTRSTAAIGILLQYTSPVWCALLAWLMQGRRLDARTAVALGVATVGVVIMIAGQPAGHGWVGPVCGILSGIAFGGLALVLDKLDRASGGGVNPALIVLFNNLGAIAVLLGIALVGRQFAAPAWKAGIVMGVGVIQLAIPYVLFQFALRRVTPVDASLLTLVEPVLNPVWVALVTPERPDLATYLGGAAILVALVLEATKKGEKSA